MQSFCILAALFRPDLEQQFTVDIIAFVTTSLHIHRHSVRIRPIANDLQIRTWAMNPDNAKIRVLTVCSRNLQIRLQWFNWLASHSHSRKADMKFQSFFFCLVSLAALTSEHCRDSASQETVARASQAFSNQEDESQESEEWIQLFNGKNLDGWTPKITGYELGDNFAETFKVEDGAIKVGYQGYDQFGKRFGHLFYKDKFSNYIIRVDYRFLGDQCNGGPGWAYRNSGIMIHGQDPKSMNKEQNFPVSIEVQLLGGNGSDDRPNANLCTPGTNVEREGKLRLEHCMNSSSKTYHGDDWVTVEVEVRGGKFIKHKIDGHEGEVLFYEKPQLDPRDADAKKLIQGDNLILTGGTISIQSESHPIEFRKIELKVLEDEIDE